MDHRQFLVFATNFKAENPYLREWLEYHLLVGVDHFYLYDQDGSEEAQAILEPYERAGVVTRHPWTHFNGTKYDRPTRFYQKNKNHMAFAHCAKTYRHQFAWVMKIDVDEFLFPLQGEASLLPYLKSIDRTQIKGLQLPRYNFGDNGHQAKPNELVITAYTKREDVPSNHKDMANSRFLTDNRYCYSAHWWRYQWWKFGRMMKSDQITGLRVNHYYTKSFEEYQARQNTSRGRDQDFATFCEKSKRANEVTDEGMLTFAQQMQMKLR